MQRPTPILVSVLLLLGYALQVSAQTPAVTAASAARYFPNLTWHPNSVIKGDFSCRGHVEAAIIGTSQSEIAVAVFLNGSTKRPEILLLSSQAFDVRSLTLEFEAMDFDLRELEKSIGHIPQGMRRSKACKGIRLDDGKVDSAHIYWNHEARAFDDWRL
jgi:hypothetical protein